MLIAQGHRILHNTRHAPIEFGKDVISIGPDRKVWVFQLKGNPGGRLTLNQFRALEGQLLELVNFPVKYPGAPRGQHRSFLVTNGEVEEEVQHAIAALNDGFERDGLVGRKLELISRGTLIDWARRLGASLWPSELTDINALLALMVLDGRAMLPMKQFHKLLRKHLRLRESDRAFASKADLKRHITSTALAVALALRAFDHAGNHFAVISAWTLFATYVIAAIKRSHAEYDIGSASIELALDSIYGALTRMCSEIQSRDGHLDEGDPFSDVFVYSVRYTLVMALMSVYWFWSKELEWPTKEHEAFLSGYIPKRFDKHNLWGEGAIPQFLAYLWCVGEIDATIAPEMMLLHMLQVVVQSNLDDNDHNLPNPYYDAEKVVRHRLARLLGKPEVALEGESFARGSYYAEPLLHLLVRTNLKQKCKEVWPDFTRLGSHVFAPATEWRYCLWRSERGEQMHRQPPLTKDWNALVEEARDCVPRGIPRELARNKYLLLLFVLICPHRGTPAAIRYLGRQFNSTWFIGPPKSR